MSHNNDIENMTEPRLQRKFGASVPDSGIILDPWKAQVKEIDVDKNKYIITKEEIIPPIQVNILNELKGIITDILAGDPAALERPEFKSFNFEIIRKAIDWLATNGALSDTAKADLLINAWRLNFKFKPPLPSEFLSPFYIGPTAETIYPHIQEAFIEWMNPMKAYRTGCFYTCIGSGKSFLTVLTNLYISLHLALMYAPWKFFSGPQPLNAKIYKPDRKSFYYMGDIKIGDKIASPILSETEVVDVIPQGVIDCYELEFENGKKLQCGLNHIHKVKINNSNKYELITTHYILNNPNFEYDFYNEDNGLIF